MTALVVRRLLIDMDAPIARNWCAGESFRTAFFDALSMSFPVGEQFFIDAVRGGFKLLPPDVQQRFSVEVQGFVGQEATHRRLHSLYNAHLARRGLVNRWEARARDRLGRLEGVDMRHWLGITAANEHFTAILADWMLRNPDLFGEQDRRLKTLWLWHSAEESEHKRTAFDLYQALNGNEAWRIRWFRRVSVMFVTDTLRQTLDNLRADGALYRWRTWTDAAAFLFGKRGLVRQTFGPWRQYLRGDFHPSQQDDTASRRWLDENRHLYKAVTD